MMTTLFVTRADNSIYSVSIMLCFVTLIFSTVLLNTSVYGVVASQDQQCFTFMYDDSSCPESWHYWGISCYKITERAFTWSDAKDKCISLGGVLAAPSSDQENEFIVELIPTGWLWIDCTDLEAEGLWKCREGNVEVSYRNWYSGEPNNKADDEDCAVLLDTLIGRRQWLDVSCNLVKRAICKMTGVPVLHV